MNVNKKRISYCGITLSENVTIMHHIKRCDGHFEERKVSQLYIPDLSTETLQLAFDLSMQPMSSDHPSSMG